MLAALAIAACGGGEAPPPATPEPAAKASPSPEPTAEPEAPTPASTTTAKADAPPQPEQSVEGPPLLMSNEKELQAAFTTRPGAKLELGDDKGGRALFRIREGSLPSAYVITFKIDPKGKSTGVPIGRTYRMLVQVENSSDLPRVETSDKPFELTLPAGNKKDANLAIGEVTTDDKGREKITWTVVAPEKIDDATGMALFKIKAIGNYWLHVTAKPPTEPAK
jgi:hypothetical protein